MTNINMKNSIRFCCSMLLIITSFGTAASPQDYDIILNGIEELNTAYDGWDNKGFLDAAALFDKAASESSDNALALYWEGTALFFLSLHQMYSRDKKANVSEGLLTVKQGIKTLTRSIKKDSLFSESYALRGVLRGIHIKLKPWSAISQGSRVGKDRSRALALNSENPRVHFLTGVSFWYAPELLGGKEKALEHYEEAEKLFALERAKKQDPLMPVWGYSTCLSFIGDLYAEHKDMVKARQYYEKSLKVNPNDPLAAKGLRFLETYKEP